MSISSRPSTSRFIALIWQTTIALVAITASFAQASPHHGIYTAQGNFWWNSSVSLTWDPYLRIGGRETEPFYATQASYRASRPVDYPTYIKWWEEDVAGSGQYPKLAAGCTIPAGQDECTSSGYSHGAAPTTGDKVKVRNVILSIENAYGTRNYPIQYTYQPVIPEMRGLENDNANARVRLLAQMSGLEENESVEMYFTELTLSQGGTEIARCNQQIGYYRGSEAYRLHQVPNFVSGWCDYAGAVEGRIDVEYRYRDRHMNWAQGNTQFTYTPPDTTPPVITIDAPTPDSQHEAGSTMPTNGTATDNRVAPTSVSLRITGGPDSVDVTAGTTSVSDGAWSTAIDLNSLGLTPSNSQPYTLVASGTDAEGNVGSANRNFYYIDAAPPVIEITTPLDEERVDGDYYFSGTATDNLRDVTSVSMRVTNTNTGYDHTGQIAVTNQHWGASLTDLVRSDTPYTVYVEGRDSAGNLGADQHTFYYGIPPVITGTAYSVAGETRTDPLYLNRDDGVATIDAAVQVEQRVYEQGWAPPEFNGGSCTIPAGQTECLVPSALTVGTDNNVESHKSSTTVQEAYVSGNGMVSNPHPYTIYSDLAAPSETGKGYDADRELIWVEGIEPYTGQLDGLVGIQSARFELKDVNTGTIYVETANFPTDAAGDNFRFEVELDPNEYGAQYEVTVELMDNFGNISRGEPSVFDMEHRPPVVTAFSVISGSQPIDTSIEHRYNREVGVIPLDTFKVEVEPRYYTQQWVTPMGYCEIPPTGTMCSFTPSSRAFGTDKSNAKLEHQTTVNRKGTSVASDPLTLNLYSDLSNPLIQNTTYNNETGAYTINGTEYGAGNFDGRLGMERMVVTFTDEEGTIALEETVETFVFNGHNFTHEVDVSTLTEGTYTVSIVATDSFGNSITENGEAMFIDSTPPVIDIAEIPSDGAQAKQVDDLHISVTDNYDDNPQLTEASITGGPDNIDAQGLTITQRVDGTFKLDTPAMYPSDQVPYTISLTSVDERGNESTLVRDFYFTPVVIDSRWGESFNIPASAIAIKDNVTGYHAFASPTMRDNSGRLLEGTSVVVAQLAASSTTAMTINGVTLQPGESAEVASAYDLDANRSVVTLPMIAAEEDAVFEVMISMDAAGAPYIRAKGTVIRPTSQAVTESWTVPHMRSLEIAVEGTSDVCRVLTDTPDNRRTAQSYSTFTDPVCIATFTDGLDYGSYDEFSGNAYGQAEEVGVDTIVYDLTIQSGEAFEVLETVSNDLVVEEANIQLNVAEGVESDAVKRVQLYTFALANPDQCTITTDLQLATSSPESVCYVELTNAPPDFEAQRWSSMGAAAWRGRFDEVGEYPVEWQVGVVSRRTGEPVWIGSGNYSVSVTEPPPPGLDILKGDLMASGHYAVDYGGGATLAVLRNGADYDVDITIASTGYSEPVIYSGVRSGNYKATPGHEGPLWDTATYTITVAYSDYPESFEEYTIEGIVMPDAGIRTALNGDRSGLDTNAYDVHFMLGVPYAGELSYDATSMGNWNVYLATYDRANDTYEAITETKALGDTGVSFTIPPETLQELEGQNRYYAVATLVAPEPELERVITSRALAPRIYKGTPVEALVHATVSEGPSPLGTRLTLRGDRTEMSALGDMQWQVSLDNGNTWEDIPDANRPTLYMRVEEGVHQFRARLTNKHSGAVSNTEAVEIWSYIPLDIDVAGPEHSAPGEPVTLTAQAFAEGEPVNDAVVVWEYRDAEGNDHVINGPSATLESEAALNLRYMVKVRRGDADPAMRSSWSAKRGSVIFETPRQPRLSLRGPRIFEVGYNYTFEATATPSWRNRQSTMTIGQEWELPDGTIVEGQTLNWSPPQALLDEVGMGGYVFLKHRTWVVGHSETTTREASKRVRLWKYVWPNFVMDVSTRYPEVPTPVRFDVRPEDVTWYRQTYGEPIHFNWTIPAGVAVENQRDGRVTAHITEPGTYTIEAEVYDERGNSESVVHNLTVAPTPPYDLRLDTYSSNRYDRAPYTLSPRLSVSGGHRENRVDTVSWFLNGNLVAGAEGPRPQIEITQPGSYVLRAQVDTELDVSSDITTGVTANPNQLPSCEIEHLRIRDTITVNADCRDPDGSVVNYDWTLDGQPIALTSYKFSFNTEHEDGLGTSTVDLVATDDSGDTVSLSRTITY